MKRLLAVVTIPVLCGLAACQVAARSSIRVDPQTDLLIQVEGAQVHASASNPADAPISDARPAHRVLESADGKVLFQYDLVVTKGEEGAYHLVLKPAAQGPTFSTSREVTMMRRDGVRVELMEQPGTGRKIVDVFYLQARANFSPVQAHMQAIHSFFRQLLHGE